MPVARAISPLACNDIAEFSFIYKGESRHLRPLDDRVILKRVEHTRTITAGIVIPDTTAKKPEQGQVMAVGSGKVLPDSNLRSLEVQVGPCAVWQICGANRAGEQ